MDCQQESRLYIKANGEVPCFCAAGEKKILHKTDENTDFVNAVLFGTPYNHIRTSLKNGKMPWEKYCPICVLMEKEKTYEEKLKANKVIEWLQVEPSFLCNLDCTTCLPIKERRDIKEFPYSMPLPLFKNLVNNISDAGYKVTLFDFQGRGEPLMNKDIWKMVSLARNRFPDSLLSLTTNGNFNYKDEIIESGLTRLTIAVDGFFEDSYKIHRRNGNLKKVFKFMEKVANERSRRNIKMELVWQYVLFGHNDSDKELIEVQKKAIELGLDGIDFNITIWLNDLKPSRFQDINELTKFPLADLDWFTFKTSSATLFSRESVFSLLTEVEPQKLKKQELKNCLLLGTERQPIIDASLKLLSKFLPGIEVDLISTFPLNKDDYPLLNIKLIEVPRRPFLSMRTIETAKLKKKYDLSLICTREDSFFPFKMNVVKLVKQLQCQEMAIFTDKSELFAFNNQ